MSNNDATFTGIPPELREMIYDYAFANNLAESKPIDLLLQRVTVPNSAALRSTSKFFYHDTRRAYLEARKPVIQQRKKIINEIAETFDQKLAAAPADSFPTVLANMVDRLKSSGPCKNHTCNSADCYMCSNLEHQFCFDCGRNLAVALHCKLHPEDEPKLVLPMGIGKANPKGLAQLLLRLPKTHTRRLTADSKTYTSSWAYCWWFTTFQTQLAKDLRCGIRQSAINKFWKFFGKRGKEVFSEALIDRLEKTDPRMLHFEHIRKTIGQGEIEWLEEWADRVETRFWMGDEQVENGFF